MEDYISLLKQNIPSGLLKSAYEESLRKICCELPPMSFGFFEIWFGDYQSRVDLNIGIDRRLNKNNPILPYIDSNTPFGALTPVEKPIRKWNSLDLQLSLFTQGFIIVYDIPDPTDPCITPWYYVTYDPSPLFSNDILFQTEVLLTMVKMLNEDFPGDHQSEWEWFFNNISPATGVQAIGFQGNRQVDSLRVVLLFGKYTDIYSFLEKHQWPSDLEDIQAQTDGIAEGCDSYRLTIDVNPALQYKIGIECLYNTLETAEKGYNSLTHKLVGRGICSEVQRKAFLEWGGSSNLKKDPSERLGRDKKHKHSTHLISTTDTVQRAPKYIKIVYEPGSPITAKGYLGFHKTLL